MKSRITFVAAALASIGLVSVAAPASAQETTGRDQPQQSTSYQPHKPLLITGGSLLLAGYATSVGIGAVSDFKPDDRLFVPIVGPWMNLAERPCAVGDSGCGNDEDLAKATMVSLGVIQAAGAGLTIASFFVKERPSETRIKVPDNTATFRIVPYGAGLGAVGRF